MKNHIRIALALVLAGTLIGHQAAHASTVSLLFSYDDPNGLVKGDFTLTTTAVAGQAGTFLVTAGTLDLAAPSADGIAGTYSLLTNPSSPGAQYSPTGLFIYDDLVMPGGSPVVTNPGLLAFGGPASIGEPEGTGEEINFFSAGPNTYDLYTGASGGYPYSIQFTANTPSGSSSVFSATVSATVVPSPHQAGSNLVAAPEPAAWVIMGAFLLIAFGPSLLKQISPRLDHAG